MVTFSSGVFVSALALAVSASVIRDQDFVGGKPTIYALWGAVVLTFVWTVWAVWRERRNRQTVPIAPSVAETVTSRQQSGGITAHTVNINAKDQEPEPAVSLSFAEPRIDPRVPVVQERYLLPEGDQHAGGTLSASTGSAPTSVPSVHREHRHAAFAFARVVNEQCRPGVGVTAKDVRCRISFFTEDNVWRLPDIKGRWRDSASPLSLSPYQLHTASEAIDIPADGEPRELDVAMKYLEDAYCFAYNNDNLTHEWSRKPEYRITEQEFIAEITVRGSNFVSITRRFIVSHGGIGTVPNIWEAP